MKRLNKYVWLLSLLVCCFAVNAVSSRTLIDASYYDSVATIVLSDSVVTITPINTGTVEVAYAAHNSKQLPSFALPDKHSVFTQAKWEQTASGYVLSMPDLVVNISAAPFAISFSNQAGLLSSEEVGLFHYETTRGFRFSLTPDEQILGGGQRVLGMDRRGHRLPLYNKAAYGYNGERDQMYYSLPAIMSNKGYVIAFDNSANGFLDIGHTQSNILQFEADAGRTAYIFSAGNTHKDVISHFVNATGKQPMPPRWALGNYASRFGYKSQQEVLDTVDQFIQGDYPLDAVVLDLYWFGADIKGHMGNLTWDTKHWPEPEQMINTLKQKGVNTIVITEPFILSSSKQWQSAVSNEALAKNQAGEPRRFDFYFGNTGLVDVFDINARDWFWQFYEKLNDQGVAGWWGDLGEPEVHPADSLHKVNGEWATANEVHNVYGHEWAKMVYSRQLKARPNERPFVMMRAGFIGSQRYGMIPWTGDVERSWNGLKPQVELALQMSLFGLAYTHSDLGGFAGGETFDAELYTRWMQYGVFQPVYRPHAQDHIAPEPIFHDQQTQDIVRQYIKLRYRLLPYNYSLSVQNSLTGIPMMRPLFLDYPKQSIERTDAYLWGDAFFVAPIINKDAVSKTVALPQGVWFDYWGNTKYSGATVHTLDAPLEKLPVLVKAGAFIPHVDDLQNTAEYTTETLKVHYYHDKTVPSSEYIMYDDDGHSANSITENKFQQIVFTAKLENSLLLNASLSGSYPKAPRQRHVNFVIAGIENMPTEVLVDNKTVAVVVGDAPNKHQAVYNASTRQLYVNGLLVNSLTIELK
ncbi:MAG: TIM-barrel domain-containing protein [Glaciecola sp.]